MTARWPGRVSVVAGTDPAPELERLRPDVVRLPLDARLVSVVVEAPTVVVAQGTAVQAVRYRSSRSRALGPLLAAHAVRDLWTTRAVLGTADGLQCDGWGAWTAYHEQAQVRHRVPPLLYFGSTLPASRLGRARSRAPRGVATPVRLAFVGRLHPADGPQYALAASRHLEQWGVPHTLDVVGEGPMEERLRDGAGPSVRFLGPLTSGPTRLDGVAASVDVAVLPYLHAHPTGTELELAGLGIPTVGFRSSVLEGHRRFAGFTTTVPTRSARGLAQAIQRLVESPARWDTLSARGVDFMARHHADARRDAQVEHLLRVAGAVRSAH